MAPPLIPSQHNHRGLPLVPINLSPRQAFFLKMPFLAQNSVLFSVPKTQHTLRAVWISNVISFQSLLVATSSRTKGTLGMSPPRGAGVPSSHCASVSPCCTGVTAVRATLLSPSACHLVALLERISSPAASLPAPKSGTLGKGSLGSGHGISLFFYPLFCFLFIPIRALPGCLLPCQSLTSLTKHVH